MAGQKQEAGKFAKFLLGKKALKIANNEAEYFTLKSGRKSPVFVNAGSLIDGSSLLGLAEGYADKIAGLLAKGQIEDFDYIFGPAYKGIPLAALACAMLFKKHKISKKFLYDRKEEKLHGDVKADAIIVGANQFAQGGKILMIDDVITTGAAKFEAYEKLKVLGNFKLVGVLVAIDRQECGGDASTANAGAADEIKQKLGCPLYAIATMGELYSSLAPTLPEGQAAGWRKYFAKWGTEEAKKWAGE